MGMELLFQPDVILKGRTDSPPDDSAEHVQSMGYWLDCQGINSISIEPSIFQKTATLVEVYIETAMTAAGPWLRFSSDPLQDGVPFELSRSALALHPLYRYVRWVVVVTDAAPPNDWEVAIRARYFAA